MTTARTSSISTSTRRPSFRFGRRALVAALAGAGVMFTALPASAQTLAPAAGTVVAHDHAAQVVVNTAMAQVGKPYVWGASGPSSFDCSGLALYAYRAAGISLPHSSAMQSGIGMPVSTSRLSPGDLVFFYSPVSHVGIYIGNGKIVHAPTAGDVVKVSDLAYMGYIAGARRLV